MKTKLSLLLLALSASVSLAQVILNPVWTPIYAPVKTVLSGDTNSQLNVNGLPVASQPWVITQIQSASFYTNFSLNTPYTNFSSLTMRMTVPVIVTEPATTLGHARISAFTSAPGGAWFSVGNCEISGNITSVLQTNQSVLTIQAGPGMAWAVSNSVAGAGYTAGFDLTATNQVTFSP